MVLAREDEELELWDWSFDDLEFLYDHLNTTEDVEKAKTMDAQNLFEHLGTYLMRGVVLGRPNQEMIFYY